MSKRVICTLTDAEATDQLGEWEALRCHVSRVEARPDGVRLTLPAELRATAEDLAARESTCCSFLDITLTESSGALLLDISSDNPAARPIIEAITGK